MGADGAGPLPRAVINELSSLAGDITDEEAARVAADGDLQGQITDEIAAREAAVLAEFAARDAADTANSNTIIANEAASSAADLAAAGDRTAIRARRFITLDSDGTLPNSEQYQRSHQWFPAGTQAPIGPGQVSAYHVDDNPGAAILTSCHITEMTAGADGTTSIQIHNTTSGYDMLSTNITIDAGETASDTAAVPYVISTSGRFVQENDLLLIEVDAVQSNPAPSGLLISLTFKKNT